MYKLDDDSIANHINERRNRLTMADGDSVLNSSTIENPRDEEFEDVDDGQNQDEDAEQNDDDSNTQNIENKEDPKSDKDEDNQDELKEQEINGNQLYFT